jgi:hypothetical protein
MQPQTHTYTTTTPSQTPAQAPAAGLRVKTHIKAGAFPPGPTITGLFPPGPS